MSDAKIAWHKCAVARRRMAIPAFAGTSFAHVVGACDSLTAWANARETLRDLKGFTERVCQP
jgi:hypothetical protein